MFICISRGCILVEIRFHERTVFISVRRLSESEPWKSHRENDEKQDWCNDHSHRHRRNHKRLRPLLLDHATSLQDIHHCLFFCFASLSDLRIAESRDCWKAKTIIRVLLTKPEYITESGVEDLKLCARHSRGVQCLVFASGHGKRKNRWLWSF